MSDWTSEELTRIAAADELELASLRGDSTGRSPVTIWVVRHGENLYVRSVNGPGAAWYRGTQTRREGHFRAGGASLPSPTPVMTSTISSTMPTGPSTAGTAPPPSAGSPARRRAGRPRPPDQPRCAPGRPARSGAPPPGVWRGRGGGAQGPGRAAAPSVAVAAVAR